MEGSQSLGCVLFELLPGHKYYLRMDMTLAQAADSLRVTPERVRQLIASGDLPAKRFGRMWMVEEQEVDRLASLPRPSGRPLSPLGAWQEIAGLEAGSPAPGVEALGVLAARLRRRSDNRRVRVHSAALRRIRDDLRLVLGGAVAATALGAPIAGSGPNDVYVRAGDLAAVLDDYGAIDDAANLVVRSVPDDVWPFSRGQRLVGPVTSLLDLADAGDRTATEALSIWPAG